MSGILMRGGRFAAPLARDGATRGRLACHLLEVRRPGRVADARRLVTRGEIEELLQRAARFVHAGVRIADRSEAGGHGEDGEIGRDRSRRPRPRRAAPIRARRGAAAPNRRSRSSGPWRSGCSRGRRRGAPPSTTSRWRAPGSRRSISREKASAARRTSVNVQRCSIRTLTCMPREPLVFGQPSSPSSSSSACTSIATRRMSAQATPGVGSRSMRSSSG